MNPLSPETIARLSAAERLDLIGQLWDSLDDKDVPLTPAQLDELRDRLAAHRAGRSEPRTWEEIEAELRQRYR